MKKFFAGAAWGAMLILAIATVLFVNARGGTISLSTPWGNPITVEIPGPPAKSVPEAPKQREEAEEPRQKSRPQAERRPARPVIPDRPYVLNAVTDEIEAYGHFATVEMPGLTPGSHVEMAVYLPAIEGKGSGGRISFPRHTIGSSGRLVARIPRYLHLRDTGEVIDLSARRYQVQIRTDEPRFRNCNGRVTNLVEGDPDFLFNPAHRAFCRGSSYMPPLE